MFFSAKIQQKQSDEQQIANVPNVVNSLTTDDNYRQALEVLKKPNLHIPIVTAANLSTTTAGVLVASDIVNIVRNNPESTSEVATATAIFNSVVNAALTMDEYRVRINRLQIAQEMLLNIVARHVATCAYVENNQTVEVLPPYTSAGLNEIIKTHSNIQFSLTISDVNIELHRRNLVNKQSIVTCVLSLLPALCYAGAELARHLGYEVEQKERIALAVATGTSPGKILDKIIEICSAYDSQLVKNYCLVLEELYVTTNNLHKLTEREIAPLAAFLTSEDAYKLRLAISNNKISDLEEGGAKKTLPRIANVA